MLQSIGQDAGDPEIAISVVTVLELAHGLARASTPDDLLAGMPVYPVTVLIAPCRIDGQMHAEGKRLALADLLIAVTALDLGYSVATHNIRHFEMIPNLAVKRY
jgi:predicted nucleic acid-binding protein